MPHQQVSEKQQPALSLLSEMKESMTDWQQTKGLGNKKNKKQLLTSGKQVVIWTPVLIGTTSRPEDSLLKKEKISYRAGDCLNDGYIPEFSPQLKDLPTLVLDLPLSEVREYLSQVMALKNLLSDEELCNYLDGTIA